MITNNGYLPMPRKTLVKHIWQQNFNFATLTSQSNDEWRFSGNGPGDPDISDIGSTTLNYTDPKWEFFTTLYQYYECVASKIDFIFTVSTDAIDWTMVLYPVTQEDAAPTSYDDTLLRPYRKEVRLCKDNGIIYPGCKWRIGGYMTTKKMCWNKNLVKNNIMAVQNEPDYSWYWQLFLHNNLGTTFNAANITCRIKITYWTKFYGLKYGIFTEGAASEASNKTGTVDEISKTTVV